MTRGVGYRLTIDDRAAVKKRYESGESSIVIAERFGVSDVAVRKTLARMGVARRGHRACHVRCTARDNAFDGVDSAAAYWTGWMMSDGYVSDDGRVELTLQKEDQDAVEKLRRFLGSTHKLQVLKGRYVRLSLRNPRLRAALIAKGVTARKSHTARVVDNLALDRDFWRGMIEGDGSIANYSNCPRVGLVGSRSAVDQFVIFCRSHTSDYRIEPQAFAHSPRTWFTYVHGRAAMKILHVLYDGAPTSLTLNRKRVIAQKLFAKHGDRVFRVLGPRGCPTKRTL